MRAVRGSCVASPRMDRLEGGGLQREAGGGRGLSGARHASVRPPGIGGRRQGGGGGLGRPDGLASWASSGGLHG